MELFTVDYALNYEGWTYDKEVAPYNVYTLDQFTIRVRRNDFFLLLYITNECDELVFCGRIYTILEYKEKIKKNLSKWKCRVYNTVNPNPSDNLEVVPRVINLTVTNGDTFNYNVATIVNESVTQLNTCTVPGITIETVSDGLDGQIMVIYATALSSVVDNYTDTINLIGDESSIVVQVVFNITVLDQGNFIVLENDGPIHLENDLGKINLEL